MINSTPTPLDSLSKQLYNSRKRVAIKDQGQAVKFILKNNLNIKSLTVPHMYLPIYCTFIFKLRTENLY